MTLAPALPAPEPTGRHRSSPTSAPRCEEVAGSPLADPAALHAFSVARPREFWRTLPRLVRAALGRARPTWSAPATTSRPPASSPTSGSTTPRTCCGRCPASTTTAPALTSVHADRPAEQLDPGASCAPTVQRDGRRAGRPGPRAPATAWWSIAPHTAPHDRGRPRRRRRWAPRCPRPPPDMGAGGAARPASSRSSRSLLLLDRTGDEPTPTTVTALADLAGLPTRAPARACSTTCRCPSPATSPSTRLTDLVAAASGRAAGDWPRLPVRPPAVRHVLLRHHRAAEGDGARRRRHAARARQGAPAARRPPARGHALLPHHHRLDDVELAAVRPGRRARTSCSTTAR